MSRYIKEQRELSGLDAQPGNIIEYILSSLISDFFFTNQLKIERFITPKFNNCLIVFPDWTDNSDRLIIAEFPVSLL